MAQEHEDEDSMVADVERFLAEHPRGMSLRDWFAGNVAQGMAAHSGTMGAGFGPGDIAQRSYEIAGAMIAARSK